MKIRDTTLAFRDSEIGVVRTAYISARVRATESSSCRHPALQWPGNGHGHSRRRAYRPNEQRARAGQAGVGWSQCFPGRLSSPCSQWPAPIRRLRTMRVRHNGRQRPLRQRRLRRARRRRRHQPRRHRPFHRRPLQQRPRPHRPRRHRRRRRQPVQHQALRHRQTRRLGPWTSRVTCSPSWQAGVSPATSPAAACTTGCRSIGRRPSVSSARSCSPGSRTKAHRPPFDGSSNRRPPTDVPSSL